MPLLGTTSLPPSGDAGGEINVTVKVDPNEEYVGRCFTLILRGETLEERIEVTQAKKNAIIAGDNRLEIGSEERTLTVEVQSNVDYTVSVKEGGEWIDGVPRIAGRTGARRADTPLHDLCQSGCTGTHGAYRVQG